jgi:uncharacterized membrane protein
VPASAYDRSPAGAGQLPAILGYSFYLLSIPSLALFAPVGAVIAVFSRSEAGTLARAHMDEQLRLFIVAAIWGLALFALLIPAWMLTLILIGIPLLWLIWAAGFVVMVWFTFRSGLGLLRLINHEAP